MIEWIDAARLIGRIHK